MRWIVRAIIAFLLALACAQPALAQPAKPAAAAPKAPEPYETWQETAPFYCSQADKDAAIELLERQLMYVNATADSARAYMQAMQQRIDQEFRDMQQAGYNQDRQALAEFQRDRRDKMILEDPQRAEDGLAKAKTAPIKDCTKRENFTIYRPAIGPLPDPKFPPCIRAPADQATIDRELARQKEAYAEKYRRSQDYRNAIFAMVGSKDQAVAKAAREEMNSAEFRAIQEDVGAAFRAMNAAYNKADDIKPCPADTGKPATPPSGTPVPPNCKPVSHETDSSLTQFALQTLEAHNAERAAVGAPPLRWNIQLEESATFWARQLAMTGRLEHSPRTGRSTVRENLQQGLPGWSPTRMLQDWIGEKRLFMPGTFPDVAYKGDVNQVLHYTQMIWPTTTELGCGIAIGGGFQWEVCDYGPGGNRDGVVVGEPVNSPPATCPGPTSIVFFDWDKGDITPQAAAILDNVAAEYQQSGKATVVIADQHDDDPTPGIKERQMRNVTAYLEGRGVPDAAIRSGAVSIGFGR